MQFLCAWLDDNSTICSFDVVVAVVLFFYAAGWLCSSGLGLSVWSHFGVIAQMVTE